VADEDVIVSAMGRTLPVQLYRDVDDIGNYNVKDFYRYLVAVDAFNKAQSMLCSRLLSGVSLQLRHHSLEVISFTSAFSSLIGMVKEQFFLLLVQLHDPLCAVFSGSAMVNWETTSRPVAEIRFKVFIVLYRLRQGLSFNCLEAQFGWAASAIHLWFKKIMKVLHVQLPRASWTPETS
jgi:hypothetical protein